MAKGYKAVWFSDSEIKAYKAAGHSQKFKDYVRTAYFEKLDKEVRK